jgi:hypothetical protein
MRANARFCGAVVLRGSSIFWATSKVQRGGEELVTFWNFEVHLDKPRACCSRGRFACLHASQTGD